MSLSKTDEMLDGNRRAKRVKISLPLQLTEDHNSRTIKGELLDLSSAGACMLLESAPPSNQQITLNIRTSDNSRDFFKTDARLLWKYKYIDDVKFRCGVSFVNPDGTSLQRLNELLEAKTSNIVTARYFPEHVVTNVEIKKLGFKLPAIVLERGLGAKERRAAAPDETNADMLAAVAKKLLDKAGYTAKDIDRVICNADPGDAIAPDTASIVSHKIGLDLSAAPTFCVSMSCVGWVQGVDLALGYLLRGEERILVMASCIAGSRVKFHNPMHRAIFGDGAGGILLERRHIDKILSIGQMADGKFYSKIFVPYNWSNTPQDIPAEYHGSFYMSPNQKVFFQAMEYYIPRFLNKLLYDANLKKEDIDLFLLHDASKPLFDGSLRALKIDKSKTFDRFSVYGNIVAAEMPVLLDEAIESGRVKEGSLICMITYGAGFTLGGLILRY